MNWKRANHPPENETFVVFTDQQQIYIGKRHQNNWLDKDDGIISDGITLWTDEIPTPPVFINGNPLNNDSKGWETNKAPNDNVYVLVAAEDSKLSIGKFSAGWVDRKGNKIEGVICSYPLPNLK